MTPLYGLGSMLANYAKNRFSTAIASPRLEQQTQPNAQQANDISAVYGSGWQIPAPVQNGPQQPQNGYGRGIKGFGQRAGNIFGLK